MPEPTIQQWPSGCVEVRFRVEGGVRRMVLGTTGKVRANDYEPDHAPEPETPEPEPDRIPADVEIDASIITTCKGRLDHLKVALPSWLNQQTDYTFEVIVADYRDPDGSADWVDALDDQRVRAVRVDPGHDRFNLAHARNCGARMARGRVMVFLDADAVIIPHYLTWLMPEAEREGVSVVGTPPPRRPGWGLCAVRREVFEAVRGFDERINEYGWGKEDMDLRERCERSGYGRAARLSEWFMTHVLLHDDAERVRFYTEKSKTESQRRIREYCEGRKDADVNPEGWGVVA